MKVKRNHQKNFRKQRKNSERVNWLLTNPKIITEWKPNEWKPIWLNGKVRLI